MANEPSMIEDSGLNAVQRTIANGSDGTDIEKYTYMNLNDPNTVAAATGAADEFGGLLAIEKVGGDGSTTTSCHMNGAFDMFSHSAGAITVGEQVTNSGANFIVAATEAQVQLGQWCGYAEEASADGTAERIRVRLRGG